MNAYHLEVCRFIDGKVQIIESEIESDKEIPGDLRTSRILLEIGNSVFHLTLTSDCPSQHPTNFMPILDLQYTVRENKILFKFFKKPMANPLLMTKSSAMPYQVKRASLAQNILTNSCCLDGARPIDTTSSLPASLATEANARGQTVARYHSTGPGNGSGPRGRRRRTWPRTSGIAQLTP